MTSSALVTFGFSDVVSDVSDVASSNPLVTSSNALVPSSFLLLVVRPGAPSSVLAPSSDALVPSSFLPVVMPLVTSSGALLLVARFRAGKIEKILAPRLPASQNASPGEWRKSMRRSRPPVGAPLVSVGLKLLNHLLQLHLLAHFSLLMRQTPFERLVRSFSYGVMPNPKRLLEHFFGSNSAS